MISESASASSAREARFRIGDRNSERRLVKIMALDAPSQSLVKRLAQDQWDGASFLFAKSLGTLRHAGTPISTADVLTDTAGRTKHLLDEIGSADLVVMIAAAGESVLNVAAIGEACRLRRVTTTQLVLATPSTPDA